MNDLVDSRVFITGGNGFLGSHLINELVDHHYTESIKTVDQYDDHCVNPIIIKKSEHKISQHNIDITKLEPLKESIRDFEPTHIFHLAACVDTARTETQLHNIISVNIEGTCNVLKALKGQQPESFVHMGTSEVYGNNEVPFSEVMTVQPSSPYSASKASSELFTQVYSRLYNIPVVYLRSFNVFGEGQNLNMLIPQVIISCLKKVNIKVTKGEQTRESNYVTNIVNGIIRASVEPKANGQIINLGCGEEIRIKDLINRINDLMGNPIQPIFGGIPYRESEIWRMVSDNSKARELLKWKPEVSLKTGLKSTIKWYSKHIDCM